MGAALCHRAYKPRTRQLPKCQDGMPHLLTCDCLPSGATSESERRPQWRESTVQEPERAAGETLQPLLAFRVSRSTARARAVAMSMGRIPRTEAALL